jgi:aconitate hydratase
MGVLPLQFKPGESAAALNLTGLESFDLTGIASGLAPGCDIPVRATAAGGAMTRFVVRARLDTPEEVVAYRHGGILPYVLRQLVRA